MHGYITQSPVESTRKHFLISVIATRLDATVEKLPGSLEPDLDFTVPGCDGVE